MLKDQSVKKNHKKQLPSLYKRRHIPTCQQNGNIKEQFLYSEKNTPVKYPDKLQYIKAHNYVSSNIGISSPSVLFNLSQYIKEQAGKKFELKSDSINQFSENNLLGKKSLSFLNSQAQSNKFLYPRCSFDLKQNSLPSKSFHQTGNIFSRQKTGENENFLQKKFNVQKLSKYDQKKLGYSFQRLELLNLAKWIDEKLEQFSQQHKKIQISDIIQYKQHILNYGLGKIIDSVTKKCRQEGQLLRILWQNSFKIFQKVLQIASDSVRQKQKLYLDEQKQSFQIYETNLSFLKIENEKNNHELSNLYEKMKRVVIWNKRLRKDQKSLKINQRILQYRNETYSQALEQTIDMFLKSVPEPSTINFAKKIISKLARQKRHKRKRLTGRNIREDVEQDMKKQAKQYVNGWLRRNEFDEFEDEQQQNKLIKLTNDQRMQLTKLDEDNKINQINIYDYFKLLDMGVQATQSTLEIGCQYDLKLPVQHRSTFTDNIFKRAIQVQVNILDDTNVTFKQNQSKKPSALKRDSKSIIRGTEKKKSNVSRFSQKSDIPREKSLKKIKSQTQQKDRRLKGQRVKKGKGVQKDTSSISSIKFIRHSGTTPKLDLTDEKQNKYYEKDFTIISEKKSQQQLLFDSDQQIKIQDNKFRISISRLGNEFSKFNNRNSYDKQQGVKIKNGRQLSIKQFTQFGPGQSDRLYADNYDSNLKNLWKSYHTKKLNHIKKKRDSRHSMNFIKLDEKQSIYSLKKLEKKFFQEVYAEMKDSIHRKQRVRDDLIQTVVRKRSFYKKSVVVYDSSAGVEQNKQSKRQIYKGYLRYKALRVRTNEEPDEQDQDQLVNNINRKMTIPSNLAKSKTLASSNETFKMLSSEVNRQVRRQPPKNKQYMNSTISSLIKSIGSLLQDYLKQIKRQKDNNMYIPLQVECQKTYYPLHTVLIQKMNYKYGLKDISDKKIKDFIEKIITFSPYSEKISLYKLLFNLNSDHHYVGTDELLIYLKCIVYLQKKPIGQNTNSIHIIKEQNPFIQKVITDIDVLDENLENILIEFFDKEGVNMVTQQIFDWIQNQNINKSSISVDKISEIIILSLLKRKQFYKSSCLQLYKLCTNSNNVFTNLYKLLKLVKNFEKNSDDPKTSKISFMNISKILSQFIKRSDIIDQIYGKSISYERFLIAYMVALQLGLPDGSKINQTFDVLGTLLQTKYKQLQLLDSEIELKLPSESKDWTLLKYSFENTKFIQQLMKNWQIKGIALDEDNYKFSVSKCVSDQVQSNIKSLLGKLGVMSKQIENCVSFQKEENNSNSESIQMPIPGLL